MKKKLYFLVFISLVFGCTLIPSKEYLNSDTLDTRLKISDICGKYVPAKKTIEKLKEKFSLKDVDSLKESFISISQEDSVIIGKNIPLSLSYGGDYKISSGKRKIYVLRNNHEKFRFIPRPDDKAPDMHFRIRNGVKSILINLNLDPDGWDYYEYILEKKNE